MKKKTSPFMLLVYGVAGFFGLLVLLAIIGAIAASSDDGNEEAAEALEEAEPQPTQAPAPAPAPEPPPEPKKSALELMAGPYAYSQENVDKRCEEEWTKRGELDRRMFNHCAQTEKSAHGDLVALLGKHKDLDWTGSLLPAIWEQWTKRGLTQYQMVNHSMEQEIDAYLDLDYEQNQPNVNAQKLSSCVSQWSRHESPFTMARHCYEQE